MKIIDPTSNLSYFDPLQFEAVDCLVSEGDVFALTIDGELIGELASLSSSPAASVVLDEDQGCVLPSSGCWRLDFTDREGYVGESYTLCVTSGLSGESGGLSGELAVWATLTMIWAATPRVRQRG